MVLRNKRNTPLHTDNAAKAAEVAAIIPSFVLQAGELLAAFKARGDADPTLWRI